MAEGEIVGQYQASVYNSAGQQIKRLSMLWEKATASALVGNYFLWNSVLDRIWLEFIGDLDPKTNKADEESMRIINKEVLSVSPLVSSNTNNFNKKPVGFNNFVSLQFMSLVKKEAFLRRLEFKLGKGTAVQDDFDDDFE